MKLQLISTDSFRSNSPLNGFSLYAVELRHVVGGADLAFHHRDPFDRLLAVQALQDQLAIISADRVFLKYGVRVVW